MSQSPLGDLEIVFSFKRILNFALLLNFIASQPRVRCPLEFCEVRSTEPTIIRASIEGSQADTEEN